MLRRRGGARAAAVCRGGTCSAAAGETRCCSAASRRAARCGRCPHAVHSPGSRGSRNAQSTGTAERERSASEQNARSAWRRQSWRGEPAGELHHGSGRIRPALALVYTVWTIDHLMRGVCCAHGGAGLRELDRGHGDGDGTWDACDGRWSATVSGGNFGNFGRWGLRLVLGAGWIAVVTKEGWCTGCDIPTGCIGTGTTRQVVSTEALGHRRIECVPAFA